MGDDWRKHARCVGSDAELFFPIGMGPAAEVQAREAKALCARCPVIDPCLHWALTMHEVEGVWGGTTGAERLALLRPGRGAVLG